METFNARLQTADYGTWTSPVTAEKISEGATVTMNMLIDGDATYWSEMRPTNKGRYTIVRRDPDGHLTDMTSPDFNARTFVHEYGGGAFTVTHGIIYSSNGTDHAIYVIKPGEAPRKLTEGQVNGIGTRFADLQPTQHGLVAVGEHHEPGKPVANFLALIDANTGKYRKIASGHDFYSSPAISPNGKKIAWISWNNPHMPWTDTQLWMADIDNTGTLTNQKQIAGKIPEAIFQPQWSPENVLYFVTDRDRGWWNLHRYVDGQIENVAPMEAETAEPLWVFGKSTYAFLGDQIVFAYNSQGRWSLAMLNPQTKQWRPIETSAVYIQQLRSGKNCVRFLESYPDKEEALAEFRDEAITILYAKKSTIDAGYISHGKHISFPSSNGRIAYGYYYPPRNQDFQGTPGTKPPLVVMIHGGPTAQARNPLQAKNQYWTSRGFAILDVDYGGSTGYGREYRSLLDLNWGIVDVEDAIYGAKYIAEQGLADENKLAIRGGSAGGFTTLAALTNSHVFKAGASYYGVADITALAHDTHKFEARYMDQLVGKYPEEKAVWEERSPINSVEKITSPLIIFQGENDTIVPPNQSIMIYEALKARQIPTELHIYPGEEHGFRQAAHIIHSLKRECEFYLETFKLGKN